MYEYLTGEDFGQNPSGRQQKKNNKYLVYNSQHSFAKFKNINEFKGLSLDST